jgi:K+-transporting ATPase ATPase A chain
VDSSTPTLPILIENPTPFTNLLEMLLILAIPAGMTYTFGQMVGDRRQGWTLFFVMLVVLVAGSLINYSSEQLGNPILVGLGLDRSASEHSP